MAAAGVMAYMRDNLFMNLPRRLRKIRQPHSHRDQNQAFRQNGIAFKLAKFLKAQSPRKCRCRLALSQTPCLGLVCLMLLLGGCQFPGRGGASSSEPEYVQNPCLVLALPMGGQFANVSSRIIKGATLAQKAMASSGRQVQIHHINTDEPNWLNKLQNLPEYCAIVGGPLRDRNYLEAKKAGQTQTRVFFAFIPNLEQGDEGNVAWRFFPSPQDQIDALTRFATDELNIHAYGALSPADNYGQRMTALLESNLKQRHIPLHKATYAVPTSGAMAAALGPLLQPTQGEDGRAIPHTRFEAIFLPDSWKRMGALTQALHANGEDRLVLLGPAIWEQGLAGAQIPVSERYALAVFPGAWDKNNVQAPLKASNPDLWTALGYDFVNFGNAMALGIRPEAGIVTARAQRSAGAIRSIAPILWDTNGIAHQRLYLFQPAPGGSKSLNIEAFKQKRMAIAEGEALGMQGWNQVDSSTQSSMRVPSQQPAPPSAPADAQEVSLKESIPARPAINPVSQEQPAATIPPAATGSSGLSTVPRPSYKLSLPATR